MALAAPERGTLTPGLGSWENTRDARGHLKSQQFKYWPERMPESRAHSQPGPETQWLGGTPGCLRGQEALPSGLATLNPIRAGTFLSKWSHIKIVQTKPLPSGTTLGAGRDAGAQLPHGGEAGPGQAGASHRVTQRPSSHRKGGAEQAAPVPCPAQPEKQASPEFGQRASAFPDNSPPSAPRPGI